MGMRIFYLGNNRLGLEVLRWLKTRDVEVVGMCLHPEQCSRFADEMIELSELRADEVLRADIIDSEASIRRILELEPDLGLSVLFGYILSPSVIAVPSRGIVNLHPALLPYNRGAYPNVWSIVDHTPAGVTLHYIDEGIDTGAIIAQREVYVDPADTGKSLYEKLERAALELFRGSWDSLCDEVVVGREQVQGEGTYHRMRDVKNIDRIDLDATYTGRQLIDILRARTFAPYRGAYFEVDGRKVYMRLELETLTAP